jgi:hypothetical protein
MKKILVILALTFSVSTMAAQSALMFFGSPIFLSMTSSGGFEDKVLVNDVQEYNQTGELSLKLQELVKGVQAEDESLSVGEAVDLIQAHLEK